MVLGVGLDGHPGVDELTARAARQEPEATREHVDPERRSPRGDGLAVGADLEDRAGIVTGHDEVERGGLGGQLQGVGRGARGDQEAEDEPGAHRVPPGVAARADPDGSPGGEQGARSGGPKRKTP